MSHAVAGLGVATTALSSGAVVSAFTGVGLVVSLPLGAIGGVCGLVSTVLAVVNKKIERKVNKHNRFCLVSEALVDNTVSDSEFKHVTKEMSNYRQVKEELRSSFSKKRADSPAPDLKKIKDEIREEFRKKIAATTAALNWNLRRKRRTFHLSYSR